MSSSRAEGCDKERSDLRARAGHVAVFVRCRPLQSKELLQQQFQAARTMHSHKCVSVAPHSHSQKILIQSQVGAGASSSGGGKELQFVFDKIYDEDASQLHLFQTTVEPLLGDCFQGYNLTILAYGQTGSGKTHTMGSSVGMLATEDEGLIPRVLRNVFACMHQDQDQYDEGSNSRVTNLRLSFVEIYNEEIRDLLHPEVPSKDIGLREDAQGRIFFVGAREEAVSSLDQAFSFLDKGCLSRTTGGTLMNATSSRSHAIFTINIEVFDSQSDPDTGGESKGGGESARKEEKDHEGEAEKEGSLQGGGLVHSYIQSKISLVDLAGSERAKRTGAEGKRLKESVGINQGLLSLGKVIRALTSSAHVSGASSFVPYRESKLTRYLQDSLGGNSRTLMFACVSKSNADLHETLSTLQYATRARAVQNKVVANVMVAVAPASNSHMEDSVVEALRRQLNTLQAQLAQQGQTAGERAGGYGGGDNGQKMQVQVRCQSQAEKDDLVEKIASVQNTISDGVLFLDDSLESGDITITPRAVVQGRDNGSRHMTEEWEGRLSDLHDTIAVLEEVRGKIVLAPATSAINGSASQAAIIALEQELQECREDLQRDEEIFSEKVNELNRFRRLLRQNQAEKIELEAELNSLTKKVHDLQVQLTRCDAKKNDCKDGAADLEEDNLEVSMAEPHISQLMEDLEMVSREKEALAGEKQRAEQKYTQAADIAKQQKEDFDASRDKLQKELKHLEIGIRMKEECIRTITREQKDIVSKADVYALRIAELEKDRSDLSEKLKQQQQSREKQQDLHVEEEVQAVHQQYKEKMRRVQGEISAIRSEWSKENDSEKALEHKKELKQGVDIRASISENLFTDLQAMKSEHRRLHAIIEENDATQQKVLDALRTELQGYKQASQCSQQHISRLEAKNASLRNEIAQNVSVQQQQQGKATALLLPPPPAHLLQATHTTLPGQKEGYLMRHQSHATNEPPTTSSAVVPLHGAGGVSHGGEEGVDDFEKPLDAGGVAAAWGWLSLKLDAQLSEEVMAEEREGERKKYAELTAEARVLREELEALEELRARGEESLARHCSDMDAKIAAAQRDLARSQDDKQELQDFLDDVRAEQQQHQGDRQLQHDSLEELEMQQLQLQIEIDDVDKKIKKTEVLLSRYGEHKSELLARISRGVLKESEANRLVEIKEELEALDAERQIYCSSSSFSSQSHDALKGEEGAISSRGGQKKQICPPSLLREVVSASKKRGGNARGEREKGLGGAISYLVSSLLEKKISCEKAEKEIERHELMLNEKSQEFEQLALVLHRTRTDLGKKIERQKKEYEDKISFLLIQLRGAELQAQAASSLMRKSFEKTKATVSSPKQQQSGVVASHMNLSAQTGSESAVERPRPHTAQSYLSHISSSTSAITGGRGKISDNAYTITAGSGCANGEVEEGERCVLRGDHEALQRKYQAEKERREVLEKRNGELARELRKQKRQAKEKKPLSKEEDTEVNGR